MARISHRSDFRECDHGKARGDLPTHVIHMTLDHSNPRQSLSVAKCECGWCSKAAWPGHYEEQDAAVEAHWREIEQEA